MERLRTGLNNMKLKTKLIWGIVIICFVPLILSFYLWFHEATRSSAEKQERLIQQNYEQVYMNLSSEMRRMKQISFMLVVEENLNQTLKLDGNTATVAYQLQKFDEITNYTSLIKESGDISKVIYYSGKKLAITGYGTTCRFTGDVQGSTWYEDYQANGKNQMWMVYTDDQRPEQAQYFTLCRGIWDFDDLSKRLGIVLIGIDLERIEKIFSCEDQLFFLTDQNGRVIYQNHQSEIDPSIFTKTTEGFEESTASDREYLYCARRVPNTDVTLLSVVPMDSIQNFSNVAGVNIIVLGLSLLCILLVIIWTVSESITKRIQLLSERLCGIPEGKLELINLESSNDEIGKLVGSYNYLVGKIQLLLENERKIGEEKKEAELRALQAQINPHFLYNTLDMIGWMSVNHEADNVQNTLQALVKYYRLVLNRGADIISLKEEMEMCSIFMDIQTRRYAGRIQIQYEVDVQPEALDALLPKITIQPLIENAIVHGINKKIDGQGQISVKASVRNGRLIVQVSDDGVGFHNRKGQQSTSGNEYGMRNIELRLNIFFRQENSVSIESVPGFGTDVYIDVPYVTSTDN